MPGTEFEQENVDGGNENGDGSCNLPRRTKFVLGSFHHLQDPKIIDYLVIVIILYRRDKHAARSGEKKIFKS